MLNVVLCPAVNVTGVVTPFKANPLPLIPIVDTVTLEPPEFVTVSDSVCLLPEGHRAKIDAHNPKGECATLTLLLARCAGSSLPGIPTAP